MCWGAAIRSACPMDDELESKLGAIWPCGSRRQDPVANPWCLPPTPLISLHFTLRALPTQRPPNPPRSPAIPAQLTPNIQQPTATSQHARHPTSRPAAMVGWVVLRATPQVTGIGHVPFVLSFGL